MIFVEEEFLENINFKNLKDFCFKEVKLFQKKERRNLKNYRSSNRLLFLEDVDQADIERARSYNVEPRRLKDAGIPSIVVSGGKLTFRVAIFVLAIEFSSDIPKAL